MQKNNLFTLFFIMVYMLGCSATHADTMPSTPSQKIHDKKEKANSSNDLAMLQAADFMLHNQFSEAITLYEKLYKTTKDSYFLKQIALAQSQAGDFESAVKSAKEYQAISKNLDDSETNLIIAEDHIRKQEYSLAIILLEKIITTAPNIHTRYILSNLYLQENMPKKALPHFIAIYNDEQSYGTKLKLESLNQIVAIYLQHNEIDNAMGYLNAYIAGNEYNINIGNFFALYAKVNRIEMLLDNLKKRFMDEQNIENARMLVSVFVELQQYKEALAFLEEYDVALDVNGKEMRMQIYAQMSNFKEAAKLAKILYDQTKRPDMLGFSAVYEYESVKKKNKKTLQPVIKTLKNALTLRMEELKKAGQNLTKQDAFFYNFLGYLMIEHDINIDEAMQYVSKALAVEPTSAEYLDSLAWGFYKQGDCKQAQETFKLIPANKIEEIPELIKHKTLIDTCKK